MLVMNDFRTLYLSNGRFFYPPSETGVTCIFKVDLRFPFTWCIISGRQSLLPHSFQLYVAKNLII